VELESTENIAVICDRHRRHPETGNLGREVWNSYCGVEQ
jgi:hypothetical protein